MCNNKNVSKRKGNEMNKYKIKFVYIAKQYNMKTTITEVIETKKEITKEYIENHLNPDIKKGIKEIIEIKIKKLSSRKEQTMQRKTYTLSEKAVKILEDLARKTRLKMSTIVEAGILEMERVYNEKNNINF